MAEVSARLRAWVVRSFPQSIGMRVLEALRELPEGAYGGQECERVQASLVLPCVGNWTRFEAALALLHVDWRDVLVGGGLGDVDWPAQLDLMLGPAAPEHT